MTTNIHFINLPKIVQIGWRSVEGIMLIFVIEKKRLLEKGVHVIEKGLSKI